MSVSGLITLKIIFNLIVGGNTFNLEWLITNLYLLILNITVHLLQHLQVIFSNLSSSFIGEILRGFIILSLMQDRTTSKTVNISLGVGTLKCCLEETLLSIVLQYQFCGSWVAYVNYSALGVKLPVRQIIIASLKLVVK